MTTALLLCAHLAAPAELPRYPQFPPADVCWEQYSRCCREGAHDLGRPWRLAYQLQSEDDWHYYQPHHFRAVVIPERERALIEAIGEPAFRAGVLPPLFPDR